MFKSTAQRTNGMLAVLRYLGQEKYIVKDARAAESADG